MPNVTQWQKIEEIYYDALDVAESERAAFVARACAGDEALHHEVASLLAARASAHGFLSQPAAESAWLGTMQPTARVGTRIGQYQLLSLLGAGGMGEVFLAEDTRLHRQVALKLLPPQFSQQAGRVRRFEQEARATTALNHPNIVTLYDTGQHENSYFIVNEFVDGQTLRAYLNEHGTLPVSEALTIAQQIATALAAAHAAGIVHRDIKPENVMLRRDGFVKVLDFGLAKLTDELPEPLGTQDDTRDEDTPKSAILNAQSQTAAGALLGTIRYMSPEQARGGSVDTRTDIFSLGVVLHEMLTGRTPFHRETATETLAAILEAEPATLPAHTPVPLQLLVTNALRKDRELRLQTADEFAIALRELAGQMQFSARLAEKADRNSWFGRWPVWAGACVLLLGGYAFNFYHRNAEPAAFLNLKTNSVMGWKEEPAFYSPAIRLSSDEQFLAFPKMQGGQVDIFAQPLNGGQPRRLTNDVWIDESPIWSPDGKQIAYLSLRNDQLEIWRVSDNGDSSNRVTLLANELTKKHAQLMRWSMDGQRLYFLTQCNAYAVDLETSNITQLTSFDSAKCVILNGSLSWDERHLAFSKQQGEKINIFVQSLEGGSPIQVTHESEDNNYPAWHPDGERIIYSSVRNGVQQICIAYLDGRATTQLTFSHENLQPWLVGTQGNRIFFSTNSSEADLYQYDLQSKTETFFSIDRKLELGATISPKDGSVVYQLADDEASFLSSSLWLKPVATDASSIRLGLNAFDPHWSPQGEQLAFLRKADKAWSLWLMNNKGEEKLVVNDNVLFNGFNLFPFCWKYAANYSWSADGRRLAYLSNKSGRHGIWTVSANGGDEQLITGDPDQQPYPVTPFFAPDNHRLAFLTRAATSSNINNRIWIADGQQQTPIFQRKGSGQLLGWSANGRKLVVVWAENVNNQATSEVKVLLVDAITGNETQIKQLPAVYPSSFRLDLSQSRLAFIARQHDRDQLQQLTLSDSRTELIQISSDPLTYFTEPAWSPDSRSLYISKHSSSFALWAIENLK